MADALFPVFDVPAEMVEDIQIQHKYRSSPLWDFEKGDFVMNGAQQPLYGTGFDAWVLWCTKTILTQRWAYYGYSNNAGIEADESFKEPDRKAQESAFTRTITEALLADPMGRTLQVRNFVYKWQSDSLSIIFTVFGTDGNNAAIKVILKT